MRLINAWNTLAIQSLSQPKSEFLYLRAICLKKLQRLDESAEDYKTFIAKITPSNYTILMHLMFAMIFKNKRKMEMKLEPIVICETNSLLAKITNPPQFNSVLLSYWGDDGWTDHALVFKKLKVLPFFCRFDDNELKKMITNSSFSILPKGKIILPKPNEVMVITSGSVLV
jgi:hypothetical protein